MEGAKDHGNNDLDLCQSKLLAYTIPEKFWNIITIMCLRFGTPEMINFPFATNGKLIILGVPK